MSRKFVAFYCFTRGICILFTILNLVLISKVNLIDFLRIRSHSTRLELLSLNDYISDWKCSKNSIVSQAKRFEHLYSNDHDWSACYANDYLSKLYLADFNVSDRRNKLFFDVGANKGYTIAAWFSTWKPQMGFSQKNLYDFLSQVLKINDCGVCSDCKEQSQVHLPKSKYLDSVVEIYAFEPIQSTYEALLQVRKQFNISTLYIHQLAISNITGVADVSKCPIGGEGCGLMSVGRAVPNETAFKTKTMTLDDFVEQQKIKQKIDLLKIDAEGADPLVLQGANKLLSQEQIRMLIFENHEIGAWKTVSLLNVIESLSNNNFICYMLGKTGMVRLTDCWSPVYDVKHWSNVLCVHQREKHLRYFLDELLIINL